MKRLRVLKSDKRGAPKPPCAPTPPGFAALSGGEAPKRPSESDLRVPTGIRSLDAMVRGGLPRNSFVLVRGDTGTAKTTLCLQYLYHGASQLDEPGIFMSFLQQQDSIYEHGASFGWDLAALSKKNLFQVARYNPHEVVKIMGEGGGLIRDMVESMGAKRLVIDSLSAYQLFFETQYHADQSVLELFEMLKKWNITTLATSELAVDLGATVRDRLGFLSDGIIHMYQVRRPSGRFRAIEIIKMRDTRHSEDVNLFKIGKDGVRLVTGDQYYDRAPL